MLEKARRLRALLGEELPYSGTDSGGEITLPGGMRIRALPTGDPGGRTLVGYAEYRDGGVSALLGDAGEKADQATLAEKLGDAEQKKILRITSLYEISNGAVVFRTGRTGEREYLLIRELKGHTGFPKGHREAGETPAENALREIREETGLAVVLYPAFRCDTSYLVEGVIHKSVRYFLARAGDADPVPQPGEVSAAVFYPLKEALARITFPRDREILIRAEKYLARRQGRTGTEKAQK